MEFHAVTTCHMCIFIPGNIFTHRRVYCIMNIGALVFIHAYEVRYTATPDTAYLLEFICNVEIPNHQSFKNRKLQ